MTVKSLSGGECNNSRRAKGNGVQAFGNMRELSVQMVDDRASAKVVEKL